MGLNKPISRRQAIKTVAVGSACLWTASKLSGCKQDVASQKAEPVVVGDGQSLDILKKYKEVDFDYERTSYWELPLGCVFKTGYGNWLPVITSGNVASCMTKACAFTQASGSLVDVVDKTVSKGPNWVIYDVSCSDFIYAWVELDMLSHAWNLYAAPFEGGKIGEPSVLWKSDDKYDPPSIQCVDRRILWQVMPNPTKDKKTEFSHCYLWTVGDSEAKPVVESKGRFATGIAVSGSNVILCPRADSADGIINYGMTVYSLDDNFETVVDKLVLPSPIKPMYCSYIDNRFVFSVEAPYQSGGLFSGMGTYIGKDEGPYIVLAREPFAAVAGNGKGVYIIKSRSSYFVVDTNKKAYSILASYDNCVDYGEYPVSSGLISSFITFSTVKDTETGYPSYVAVRAFEI